MDLRAANMNHTNGSSFAEKRSCQGCSNTTKASCGLREFLLGFYAHIMNVDRLLFEHRSAMYRPPINPSDLGPMKHDRATVSCHAKTIILDKSNHRVVCAAYTSSVCGNHIQHWLNISRRAGDHAQDFT